MDTLQKLKTRIYQSSIWLSHQWREIDERWLVFLWMGIISFLVFSYPFFYDMDDYFHVAVAKKLGELGIFLKEFPWARYSIWQEHYFDKEWLFHVALVPLVWLLDGVSAGKVMIIIVNGVTGFIFWWVLSQRRAYDGGLYFFLIAGITLGGVFDRYTLCRPHLFSLPIYVLGLWAIITSRRCLTLICGILYALAHTAHWQYGIAAIIADLINRFYPESQHVGDLEPTKREGKSWIGLWAILGVLIGERIHPQFPNNLLGLWWQNVVVLKTYWWGGDPALWRARPQEIRSLPWTDWFQQFGGVSLLLMGLVILIGRDWKKKNNRCQRDTIFVTILSVGYGVLCLLSPRFIEYLGGTLAASMALLSRDMNISIWSKKRWGSLLVGITIFLLGWGMIRFLQSKESWYLVSVGNQAHYADCAAYLHQNFPPGTVVVAMMWSDNPALFYGAPHLIYSVFLDPLFMYLYSQEIFYLWDRLRYEICEDTLVILRDRLRAKVVFVQAFYGRDGRPLSTKFQWNIEHALGKPIFISSQGHRIYYVPD